MPVGFADGVDNDMLAGLMCSNGELPKWNGSAWTCAADSDTTYTAGTGLTLSGGAFNIAIPYRLPQACSDGQLPEWDTATSTWVCTNATTGDITAVTAGTGLTGGGTSGDVTLSLNTAYTDGRYWMLGGNSLSAEGSLGSLNAYALNFLVNNQRALRLEPSIISPNVIGGSSSNSVTSGVAGATIGGGASNAASGYYAAIGGGYDNNASRDMATIGGGWQNTASGIDGTVGGGSYNIASAMEATVGGGQYNTASGQFATVPGGQSNTAQGYNSFAAGRRAKANNQGCFVWGDATDADVTCSNDNRAIFRSSGGYYIYTNSGLMSGMYLSSGGSSWNAVSNRALKENFAPVDTAALLEGLAAIPISTWNYKAQDPAIRHIGPMADDFNALVDGLGGEGADYINSLDADGVALAAIQGLYQQVQEKDAQIANLEARLMALEQERCAANTVQPTNLALPGAGLLLAAGWVWMSQRREKSR